MHPDSGGRGITDRSAAAVEGDDVARVRIRAAYSVAGTINLNAGRKVPQRLSAGDVGTDDVALD